MPAELLLVGNPARRRRKSARKASRAQLRARARFAAMARGRALPNPVKHRRRRAHVVHHHRRVRRNPIGGHALRGLMPMIKAAGLGGAGAIAVDLSYGFAMPYLPAMVQTPLATGGGINPAYYLAKGAFTVALGVLAKKALGAKAGTMTEGALAVLMHDGMKQFVQGSGMALPLGFMPGGRVLPPLPMSQTLRKYVGPQNNPASLPMPGRGALRMYVPASQRENAIR